MGNFNGLGVSLGNLSRLSHARSRSISPENLTGEKGQACLATEGTGAHAARDLGIGWKISPSIVIKAGETRVLADIDGPGAINHIWMPPTGHLRHNILRFYWNSSETPSVECPVGAPAITIDTAEIPPAAAGCTGFKPEKWEGMVAALKAAANPN